MFGYYAVDKIIEDIEKHHSVSDNIASLDNLLARLQAHRDELQASYDAYADALKAALAQPDAWDFLDLQSSNDLKKS